MTLPVMSVFHWRKSNALPQPSEAIASDIWDTALPALLLGRIAIDQRNQCLGHARSLMRFALTSAVNVSRNVGSFCMLAHPLDGRIRTFSVLLVLKIFPVTLLEAWRSASLTWSTMGSEVRTR